jgi:hypothetical protein
LGGPFLGPDKRWDFARAKRYGNSSILERGFWRRRLAFSWQDGWSKIGVIKDPPCFGPSPGGEIIAGDTAHRARVMDDRRFGKPAPKEIGLGEDFHLSERAVALNHNPGDSGLA